MRGMEHLQSGGLCQGRENWGQGVKRLEGDSKRVIGVTGKRIYTGKVKKVSSIQFSCSVVSNSLRPQLFAACQASLSIPNSRSLLKLMSIESVIPSNHLIFCRPLLLPPSIFPSIRVFSSESVLHIRWPEYWNFSFSISLSNEHLGPISFRMDWLDLLAVQGTLESSLTPQFKSINSSTLCFLHSPTLTSIHDHWKNQSFDSMDLCGQSNVSAFQYAV